MTLNFILQTKDNVCEKTPKNLWTTDIEIPVFWSETDTTEIAVFGRFHRQIMVIFAYFSSNFKKVGNLFVHFTLKILTFRLKHGNLQ